MRAGAVTVNTQEGKSMNRKRFAEEKKVTFVKDIEKQDAAKP